MRWRTVLLVAAASGVLLAASPHSLRAGDEPTADGHPLSYWLAEADHDDLDRRSTAFSAFKKFGRPAADGLAQRLREGSDSSRRRAAEMLLWLGPAANGAAATLAAVAADDGGDEQLGDVCAEAMVAVGPPADAEALALLRRDGVSRDGQRRALEVAGRLKAAAVVPLALARLRGADPALRVASAWALGQVGRDYADAVPDLVAALDDRDDDLREAACYAIAGLGEKGASAKDALVRRFADDYADVRTMAAIAVAEVGGPDARALPALAEALDSMEPWRPLRAIAALARWAKSMPEAQEVLVHLLDRADNASSVPVEASLDAAIALMSVGRVDNSVVKALVEIARTGWRVGDRDVGAEAATALGRIAAADPERARALLLADDANRGVIVSALEKAGEKGAEVLGKVLAATTGAERRNLIVALGGMGPDARVAAPVLLSILEHSDDLFERQEAFTALFAVKPLPATWDRVLRVLSDHERERLPDRARIEDSALAEACVRAFGSHDARLRAAAERLASAATGDALVPLLACLSGPTESARRLASTALARCSVAEATLTSALASDSPDIVRAAARVLLSVERQGTPEASAETIALLLRHPDEDVFVEVLDLLRPRARGMLPALVGALDAARGARRMAILALVVRADAESEEAGEALLAHASRGPTELVEAVRLARDAHVLAGTRIALGTLLLRTGTADAFDEAARGGIPLGPESVPAVEAALRTEDAAIRRAAIAYLSGAAAKNRPLPATVVTALEERLSDPDRSIARAAVHALHGSTPGANALLKRLAAGTIPPDLVELTLAAAPFDVAPSPAVIEAILSLAGAGPDTDGPVPVASMFGGLGQLTGASIGGTSAGRAESLLRAWAQVDAMTRARLLDTVSGGDRGRRLVALRVLASAPIERWQPVLAALTDGDQETRRAAAEVFAWAKAAPPPEAMPVLGRLLDDPDAKISSFAVRALGTFGTAARGLLPNIEERVRFGVEGWNRSDIGSAIRAIRGEARSAR